MGVVFLVPLIALSPFFSGSAEAGTGAESGQGAHWSVGLVWLYLIVTVASAIIGRRIKLPTAYLLGPIMGTSALVIAGTPAPHLPAPLLDIAQIAMGAYLGLMLKPARIAEKGRAVLAAVVTGLALILFSMASAFVLTALHGVPYLTAFIALAPGGHGSNGNFGAGGACRPCRCDKLSNVPQFFHFACHSTGAEKMVCRPLVSVDRTMDHTSWWAVHAVCVNQKERAVTRNKYMLN